MDHFEVLVQGEQFRISERTQPGGTMSYDFAWLNGPANGANGFTVGRASGGSATTELVAQARQFVDAFYGPGGSGETDFPYHTPVGTESDDA